MDIKKLSQFIIALGIIVLAVGGIMIALNQPKTFTPAASQPGKSVSDSIFQHINNSGAELQNLDDNRSAQEARGNATKVMIAGAIVLFIGFGVSASVKKT